MLKRRKFESDKKDMTLDKKKIPGVGLLGFVNANVILVLF